MYSVIACREVETSDGYKKIDHLPTFFLDERIQGIVSVEHAERIAKDILGGERRSPIGLQSLTNKPQ